MSLYTDDYFRSLIKFLSYSYVLSTSITTFDLKVGGLNETELYDLRQIPSPFNPLVPDVERFGAWSASFRLTDFLT